LFAALDVNSFSDLSFISLLQTAQSILKQDYKDEVTLAEAGLLAVKVLSKTMDTTTLSSERCLCNV
jgi:hypothetical protein